MLREIPLRRNHAIWRGGKSRDFPLRALRLRHLLAGVLDQFRFVLEEVHLADAAFHEQEDAALGLCRMMRGLGCEWIIGRQGRRASAFSGQQIEQRKAAQAQIRIE